MAFITADAESGARPVLLRQVAGSVGGKAPAVACMKKLGGRAQQLRGSNPGLGQRAEIGDWGKAWSKKSKKQSSDRREQRALWQARSKEAEQRPRGACGTSPEGWRPVRVDTLGAGRGGGW